jgi:hypothetical protein
MKHLNRLILALVLLFGCKQPGPHSVTPAFYYWKQGWDTTQATQAAIRQLPAGKLYIKLFDLAPVPGKGPLPVAVLNTKAPLPENLEIVPVVFLMNEVWAKPDTALPSKVANLVADLCSNIPAARIREIQVDCDWTQTTKAAYFSFLEQIRRQPFFKNRQLSATVRLYQLKYADRAGIPPVDRGLLMCYNMGNMRQAGRHNSILDIATLQSYLGTHTISRYSLPLDVALPLFEWQILFRQGTVYEGIVRQVKLDDNSVFAETGNGLYTVKKDTLLEGYSFRTNDVIRREFVDIATLKQAARLLARQLPPENRTVIYYHLDSLILRNYPLNELQEIIRILN